MNKKIALGCCVCIVLIVIVIAIILFFKPTSEYNYIQDMVNSYNNTKPQYEYYFGSSLSSWVNPYDLSNIPGKSPTLMLALYDNKAASTGFNFNDIYTEPLNNGLKNAEKVIWDIITTKINTVTTNDMTTPDASANVYFGNKGTVVDSSLNSLIREGEITMARTYLVPGYKYWIGHNNIGLTTNGKDQAIQTDKRAASADPWSFVFTPG